MKLKDTTPSQLDQIDFHELISHHKYFFKFLERVSFKNYLDTYTVSLNKTDEDPHDDKQINTFLFNLSNVITSPDIIDSITNKFIESFNL